MQLCGRLAEEGLTVPASTIYRILVRHGICRLRDLDVAGEDLRELVRRYEYDQRGDLVHVDVKKLGWIPVGGGQRVHASGSAATPGRRTQTGTPTTEPGRRPVAESATSYLHTAIDDHSRLAYTEELLDEKGPSAAAFRARAPASVVETR